MTAAFSGTTAVTGTLSTIAGFTPTGVTSGSVAAAIQSIIGNVIAVSLFAILQSLGASGVFGAMSIIGGLVSFLLDGLVSWFL